MKRFKLVVATALALATICLVLDYYRVNAKDARVVSAVKQLGGRFGSIPVWPLGTEYRISFDHPLTEPQLNQLAELNNLRGWVGVRFVDCDLSASQQADAIRLLESCHIYWNHDADADTIVLNTPD